MYIFQALIFCPLKVNAIDEFILFRPASFCAWKRHAYDMEGQLVQSPEFGVDIYIYIYL